MNVRREQLGGRRITGANNLSRYEERERTRFLEDVLGEFYRRDRHRDFFGSLPPPKTALREHTRLGLRAGSKRLLEEYECRGNSLYELIGSDFAMADIESGRCFAAGIAAHVAPLGMPQAVTDYAAYISQNYVNFLLADSIPKLRAEIENFQRRSP